MSFPSCSAHAAPTLGVDRHVLIAALQANRRRASLKSRSKERAAGKAGGVRKFCCPTPGCKEAVKYVRFAATEVLVPGGKNLGELPKTKRGHIAATTQRNIVVDCPVHGQQYLLEEGHHVTVEDAMRIEPAELRPLAPTEKLPESS